MIHVTIEELVLEGFHPADRHRIAAAIEARLAELLTAEGLHAARPGNVASLEGGHVELRPAARAEETGAAVAQSVFGALQKHGCE